VTLLWLVGSAAWACAVCQDPTDVRAGVYYDMTLFMSLLPLTTMGLGGFWLYRRAAAAGAL
jgi:hypothetical protein